MVDQSESDGALNALSAFKRNVSGKDAGADVPAFFPQHLAPLFPSDVGFIGNLHPYVADRSAEVFKSPDLASHCTAGAADGVFITSNKCGGGLSVAMQLPLSEDWLAPATILIPKIICRVIVVVLAGNIINDALLRCFGPCGPKFVTAFVRKVSV